MRKSPNSASRRSVWKSPAFIKRLSSWLVLTTAITLAASYGAQIYQWDPDANAANNNVPNTGDGLGGGGTWDTAASRWWNGVNPDQPWNNGTFDTAVFGGLTGGTVTVGAPVVAGRLVFNTGGYVVTPTSTNTLTLETAPGDPAPVVTANANATIGVSGGSGLAGTQGLTKNGGGILTVLGDNTGFSGTVTLKNGTLAISGGSDSTPTGSTSLGVAQPIFLEGGTLRFLNDAGIAQYNNDITLNGNATINVDRAVSTSGGVIELGALTINSNTLTTTNGNGFGLRFMGTTTLNSAISTISATFNPTAGIFNAAGFTTLAGLVTGSGALNKTGAGTLFVYTAGFSINDYEGGTNVFQGTLALGDTFTQLGYGRVIVNPAAALRIEDNLNFFTMEGSGAGLHLQSSSNALSVLGLDGDFSPSSPTLADARISPYGVVVEINSPTTQFSSDFNFANIGSTLPGNGKIYLGAIVNTALNGFTGQIMAGADNEYRLGANSSAGIVLSLTIPNLINGGAPASLVVGVPIQNIQNITNGTGTVSITEGQNYGGLTTVNFGSTLATGGNPTGNPLGNGSTINVFGTLNLTGGNFNQLAQTTINVAQARATNGVLTLNLTSTDFAGVGSNNERLNPNTTLNFSGGTFNLLGYTSGNANPAVPLVSSQTIGTFNSSAANTVNITTSGVTTTNLDAILTFTNLNRLNHGTVAFAHSGATQPAFGKPSIGNGPGIPTNQQNSSDIRVFITNLNGGGAPAVTNGMIAPWLIDVTNLPLGASGATTNGSTIVTVDSAIGLSPGMLVTGGSIPIGSSVVTVADAVRLDLGSTTNTFTTVTVGSTAGLVVGMRITGPNIQANTTIASITNGTTFELSLPANGTASNLVFTSSALFTISRAATGTATGQTLTANAQQFLTYGANGIAPAAFDVQAATAAQLQAATTSQKVTVDAAMTLTTSASVYALRLGDNVLGRTNATDTITIGALAPVGDGAGLILNQATARTHTPNFTFGTGGNREAIIYVTGGQTATLSGVITADGLTKFGANTLFLTGANSNLTGTITLNQGTLDGSPVALNFRPITINAGTLSYDGSGSAFYHNDITVTGDATISAGDVEMPRINSLTINARATGDFDPIVLTIPQGLSVTGDTTLLGNVSWIQSRGDRNNDLRARVMLAGKVTGPGSFDKWSGTSYGATAFLNGANDYGGPTTINGGALESLTSVGTPFSTGEVTINPGGTLRIVHPTNISGNVLTVNSDLNGLAVISLAYSGAMGLNGDLTGTMNFNNGNLGGPFSAVFAIDAVGYSGAIDFSTLGGGTGFLGTSIGGNFSGALTPGASNSLIPDLNGGAPIQFAGGVYRLGGGGTGILNLTGATNQLTGDNVVQIGAISNVTGGASVALVNGGQNNNAGTNGNSGAVQILNANNYTGPTILNGGVAGVAPLTSPGVLSVGHSGALGTSKIIFNGGGLEAASPNAAPGFLTSVMTLNNDIGFTGDAFFYGPANLRLTGPVSLADNQVGVTRTLTVANTTNFGGVTGITTIAGDITDGAGTASLNSITKAGTGVLEFTGNNTYSGFTNINVGTILVSNDSSISPNSQITFNGGTLGIWKSSFTTDRNYTAIGNAFFDVGVGRTFTQSLLSNISGPGQLIKTGQGRMILGGSNSGTAANQWFIDNGTLVARAAVNLGDPTSTGAILLRGGGLQADGSFSIDRRITNDTNVYRSGFVDVTGTNVFTTTRGIDSLGTASLLLTKTGSGTFENSGYNTVAGITVTEGTFSTSSNAPLIPGAPLVANTASNTTLTVPGVAINSLYIGLPLFGPGIAANTRITAIDYSNNTATLSVAATATAAGVTLTTGAESTLALHGGTFRLDDNQATSVTGTSTAAVNNSLVTVPTTAGLVVGQSVVGPNIPANTTILAIRDGTTFRLSQTATAANTAQTTFTLGKASQAVTVGNLLIGGGGQLELETTPGFSSQLTAVRLSRLGTGTLVIKPGTSTLGGAGDTNAVRFIPTNMIMALDRAAATVASSTTLTVPNTADLFVGMSVTGTNIPANATITAITSPTTITISAAPTTASNTFITFSGVNPRANLLNNGIFPASILTEDASGVASFTANNAATGIVPFTGYTAIGAAPANFTTPTVVGNVGPGGTTLTGINSLYALRTSGSVTGGTLKIGSISSSLQGGIIVNANANIGSNLVFDPTTSDATKVSTASGEGLFYVAPNVTATISGGVTSNSFTKFGGGTAVLAGALNGIFGALTIQDGTLKIGTGANAISLETDLVLNGEGVLDLNGNGATFNALYNNSAVGGGVITNNGASDATLTITSTTPTVAAPPSRTGTIGQNNRIITGLASTADLQVGMTVTGTNIAAGAYILSIDSPTQITLSAPGNNANVAASAQTVNFGSSIYAGQITDGLTNKLTFVKNGNGTVILGGFSNGAPRAGENTYTGGTIINQGTLQIHNPLALGGADGSTPGTVTLAGGILELRNDGAGVNQTIVLGNQSTNGVNVNLTGPATINVDRLSNANTGGVWQINNLNLTENSLSISGANNFGLRVAGTTTIAGRVANITNLNDQANGNIEFAGLITGAGALNKFGGAAQRTATISYANNTYTGGTNVISGSLQVTATTGTPFGTGQVNVMPGAMLRIAGLDPSWLPGSFSSVAGQAQLRVNGSVNSLGVVALDNSFDPSSLLTATTFSNAYGTLAVGLGTPFFSQALDMSAIGDGRAFLISALNTEVAYVASSLIPGVGNGVAPRTYRLAGGVSNLAFTGADNVFNDLSGVGTSLQVGPAPGAFGTITLTGNSVIIRNSNSYTGGTTIGRGSIVLLGVGGSPAGSTPFGSATGELDGAATNVLVYGTVQLESRLESSFFNAATGKNASNLLLRPGGNINLFDFAGDTAGGNDRWADTDANGGGLNLNGGSFRYSGAAHIDSVETVGTFTVEKNSRVLVDRTNGNTGSATLIVNDFVRANRGTLTIQPLQAGTTTANILGLPALTTEELQFAAGYDRLIVSNGGSSATTLGGLTTGGLNVVNQGMAPAWIVDVSTHSFVTYNPTAENTGYQSLFNAAPLIGQASYSNIQTTGGSNINLTTGLNSGLATVSLNQVGFNGTAAITLQDNPNVYALRVVQSSGTNNNSTLNVNTSGANNTITIASGGLIIGSVNSSGGSTYTVNMNPNLVFGSIGTPVEALIYAPSGSNGSTTIINGNLTAAGVTKFGTGQVNIYSINPNISSTVVVNQGNLLVRVPFSGSGSPVPQALNGQDVILNGGAIILEPFIANAAGTLSDIASPVRAQALFDSNIFVFADSTIGNNGQAQYARLANLTFDAGSGATALTANDAIALNLQSGLWVRGTTTLIPQARFNSTFNGFSQSTFAGLVTGTGPIDKIGNGAITVLNGANNYSGGTVVHGAAAATAVSTVASAYRGTGTPFGTGTITINPGGLLRIADNANIASNAVTLKSDGFGLGGLGIAHNGALPAIITAGVPTAGQVKVESTGPFDGVLSLDYGYYSQDLNPATVGNGNWWIGNSQQAEAFYFNDTLGLSANGKYLLGGGGNQSGVNYGSVLVSGGRTSLFENIFSGGTANQVRIEIGAQTADFTPGAPSFVNGNSGFQVMVSRNTGLTGDVRVNVNTTLALGNSFALGSGRLVMNGGTLRYDFGPNNFVTASIVLDNNVLLSGDWATSSGAELVLNGNVAMHEGTAGATRIWNLTGSGAMAVGLTAGSTTNGVISGAEGSNLIKRGAQQVSFRGTNTYQGYTQIDRGEIVVVGNVLPGVNGPLGNSVTPIVLGSEGANLAGDLGIGGKFTVGRDIVVSGVAGTELSLIRALTNETAIITGNISISTGAVLTLGAVSGSHATGSGGRLDILGGISGPGAVVLGTTAAVTSFGGTVAFLGSSNGYGLSTYTGGTTFNSSRVEIGADAYFTGPANSPTIISGPFGTGAMTWTSGEGGNGAEFLAVGGARTIVNAFAATSSDANATWKFMGHEALTFTGSWNLHSGNTLRNRTLQVSNPYQPTTFSGNLSISGTQGINLLKAGSGMLILTGTNTFANLLTTDGNYGTGLFIDDGIVRVNADAALGSLATLADGANGHTSGPADVQLRGGYLSISTGFSSNRQIVLTSSAGGIDVAAGQTLTLTKQTRGAFGLRKVGPGTLALNSGSNTITDLTLGGAQQLNPGIGFFSHTGGTVSTTATSGTPFATTSVTINSGTLALANAAGQTLSIPTITYGAAGQIAFGANDTLTASTGVVRGGAFNSVSYGTLTINPSSLANLGGTEKLVSTAAPANTAGTGGNILTTPSVFMALAGGAQDANFTRYNGASGFAVHNVTTVATLAATAPTNVGDILAPATVGAAPNAIIDVLALRTAANIGSFDGSQLLRILGGGLIINGATASTLSSNVLFGSGTGASLTEAIVYVRSQTGTSAISGNITARDFTKTGAGALTLSGSANLFNSNAVRLPVLSIQDGTLRFATAGAQFTNERRPAATTDQTGHYVLNVNEAGIFDLNGLDIIVGGLTGNGTVTSNIAGAATFTVKNGVDTTFSGGITDGAGTVAFTKSGNGTLIFNGHSSHTGGTTVEAGRVLNATGSTLINGLLDAQTVTALGTGPIVLAGGDLRLNGAALLDGAQTTNEVTTGIDGLLFGGPNGYDITIASTAYTNGVALPANMTSTLRAATQNALINSLTVNAPMLTSTEGIVLVKGATTFSASETIVRATSGRLFLQGQINAAGKTITKIGYGGTAAVGELVVTNTESGLNQNNVGLWKVYGGTLNARSADGGANPLGANSVVELNGGSTNYGLLLSTDGDGTAAAERVTTYADTMIRFGSPLGVSSSEFVSSGASRLQTDRILGTNDDKTIVIGALEIRGALGSPYSYFNTANASSLWVEGTTDFQRDWTFQADGTAVTFNGVISGNGTLNRRSNGASVYFNAVNTYNGGTFFVGSGRNILGSYEGNQVTLSNTAKLGTGHVFMGPLASFQINDAGNLRADQNFYVSGNLSWASTFSLAADLTLEQVRLRSAGLGGIQNSATDYYLNASNPSAAVLALGTVYTQALDMSALGDGMWFLGSMTNMVGASGSYDAATLGVGLGNTYRIGAGGATLFFGSNGVANVLTDVNASTPAHVVVGAPMNVQNNGGASTSGTAVLLQNQNYTGSTVVNRGSTLDFRGTMATSGFEVYGTLNVAGEAGTFLAGGSGSNIPVTLRPGSTLRFDNTSAGVLPVTSTQGRWEDSVGLTLNNSILRLQGSPAVEVAETVGTITSASGTNQIQVVRGVVGRGTELRTPSIDRPGNGTIQFVHNGSQLGSDERVIITGTAPVVTNGMVAPWMVSASDTQFVTYNADLGFTIAGFDRVQAAATLASNVTALTDRTLFSGAVVLNSGVDFSTYALRLDGNVTLGTAADNTAQLIIGSGGLISNGTRTITSGIVAGSIGTPAELLIYNNGTTTIGASANFTTSGQILATSITKFGAGTLQFLSNNTGFTGDIRIQQGALEFNYSQTSAANPTTVNMGGNGGNIIFEGANTTLNIRGGNDSFTGDNLTFTNNLVLGDYVPIVNVSIDRSGGNVANKVMVFNNLTFGLSNGDVGQIFRVDGRNGFDLRIAGTTTLKGRSAFSVENAYTGSASDLFLDGQVTGTGTLIKGPTDSKGREMTLRNVTSLNNWTDGTVLQGGTLRIYARANNVAAGVTTNITAGGISTGDITLMQGTLDLRVDSDVGGTADTEVERVIYQNTGGAGPNVILNGSTTINVDRTGLTANGTNKQMVLGNLTMGQQMLTVTGANGYGLEFGGTTTLLGNAFINNSTDLVLNGAISTDGGAIIFNKVNTGNLWINSANPTLAANVYVNAGLLTFGNRLTTSTTANIGSGDIFVNAGGTIRVNNVANINTGLGQQVVLTGTQYAPAVFRANGTFTQAEYASMIQTTTPGVNQVIVLALEANTANALNLSTLGNGRIYLGANGDRTYSAASLDPGLANFANSVIGGTSANPVYRLTHTTGNTLTINLSAGGLADVGGATDVQIGSQAILGPNGNLGSNGFVYFQDQNTYTGQTVVARSATLRFNTAMSAGNTAGPLGANANSLIDVYGGLRVETNGSFLANGATTNFYTNIRLHPTSTLTFQDIAASGVNSNRWDDTVGINLDGSALVGVGVSGANNATETFGALVFDRGSRIVLTPQGTGDVFLVAASVTRAAAGLGTGTGRGTLVFTPTNTANFGSSPISGTVQQQVRFTAAPTTSATSAVANMLPGYYVESNGNRFVTHNATTGVVPVADGSMVAFTAGMTAGSAVVNTGAVTLPDFNPFIYALRTSGTISSPTGANNDATITFGGSGADVGSLIIINSADTTTVNIHPNLKFGATGTNEALIYFAAAGTNRNAAINGNITAGGITKFGTGTLQIANDQSDAARGVGEGYSSGWVINEGAIQLNTFGSAGNAVGTNTIVLNGSQAASAQLNLRAQPADSLLNYTYTSGKIYAVDFATIDFDPGADDRVHSIADIEIQQSGGIGNAPANGTVDAYLRVANNRNRTILSAGSLTVASNAILNVDTTATPTSYNAFNNNTGYLTNGLSSGMSVASLIGSNRLTKWGDGTLYVRGASPGFTGPMVIDQGAVFVTNNGSLGTGELIVNRYGTLEIGVANFAPTNSSVTYNEGSIERWSVDSARSGAVDLGKATLQVAANQATTSAEITLNGGGIEAFVRNDDLSSAHYSGGVQRILNPNVLFDLAGDSFLGTRFYEGANGLDAGRQTHDNRPMEEYLASGAILEVQGVISGIGGLTKVGYDTVILSGLNTYAGGTFVTSGKLMIGKDNALPTTGTLSTTANGVLDLNGQNQTVGRLTSPVAVAAGANSTSGFITNSATTVNTLTVDSAVDAIYSGVIQHNLAVTKNGANVQTLTNVNTYVGPTSINDGVLEVAGSLTGTSKVDINAGGTLSGGATLANPLTTALSAGPINVNNGGTFSPGVAGTTAGVGALGTFNATGGLTTSGGGTLAIDLQTPTTIGVPGGLNDRIDVTGSISLAGTTAITLTLTGGYNPALGDLFFIALNDGVDSITGSPANFTVADVGGVSWQVFTGANWSNGLTTGGNDIAILAVVPEPNALSMLVGSLGMALGLQRFRRRRREC